LNPRPLGYEPYDVRLCRLALSLVAALTSADGRRAFMPGLRCLPRLNLSRRVLCTNSCTNLVTESLAVPTQVPSWDGVTVDSPALAPDRIRNRQVPTSGSICSVDQWKVSGQCAGARIRRSASCQVSGMAVDCNPNWNPQIRRSGRVVQACPPVAAC
jgi:hypothetical protein